MEPSRLTKRVVEFYEYRGKAKTGAMNCESVMQEDLDAAAITQAHITERKTFRLNNVLYWKVGLREKRKKTRTVWSDAGNKEGPSLSR